MQEISHLIRSRTFSPKGRDSSECSTSNRSKFSAADFTIIIALFLPGVVSLSTENTVIVHLPVEINQLGAECPLAYNVAGTYQGYSTSLGYPIIT